MIETFSHHFYLSLQGGFTLSEREGEGGGKRREGGREGEGEREGEREGEGG